MKTLEDVKRDCRDGWKLNPNEKVVNGILRGINKNNGECPCQNDSQDKRCPCSNYRLHDKCCCTLYVKDEDWGKPLKVGDECDYFSSILSGTVTYNCVVEKVLDDGVTYFLKEIPWEGESKCNERAALFTDNPEHYRTFVQQYGDIKVDGRRGIRRIRRK